MNPYTIYLMVPLSMTMSDFWPRFLGQYVFWSRISEKRRILKTKVTIAQEETIPNIWKIFAMWPWLTSKRIAQVCQHQLSFLFSISYYLILFPFSGLTLLVGQQEGHPACKNWVLVCCWWWFDWSFARLIAPVVNRNLYFVAILNEVFKVRLQNFFS